MSSPPWSSRSSVDPLLIAITWIPAIVGTEVLERITAEAFNVSEVCSNTLFVLLEKGSSLIALSQRAQGPRTFDV